MLFSFLVQKLFPTVALAWKTVVPEAQSSVIGNQENEIIANNVDTSSTKQHRRYCAKILLKCLLQNFFKL